MAYLKPNPIKQLQAQDQYKQDFEGDLLEAGGETPLMKVGKDARKKKREERMDERIADGSTELKGGSDVGNFFRRNSYNNKKRQSTNTSDSDLVDYLKDQERAKKTKEQDLDALGGSAKKMGNEGKNKIPEKTNKNKDIDSGDQGV